MPRYRYPALPESEITPESLYRSRRRFMKQAGSLALAASLPGWAGSAAASAPQRPWHPAMAEAPTSPFSTDESLTEKRIITSYNNFFEFGSRKRDPSDWAHYLQTDPWAIKVEGEVNKPGTYDLDALVRAEDLEERIYRLRCVEAWSMVVPWVGFELRKLIERLEPTSRAKYVVFETLYDPQQFRGQRRRSTIDWPYTEGLRMDEAMHPLTLLAVGLYGKPMPNQNGAPIRLVVPWKYGFKSIKSIVTLRFQEQQPVSTWEQMAPDEYGFYANVNPNVSHPRWSQARERRLGEDGRRETLMFNGYADEVAQLYQGMDLEKHF